MITFATPNNTKLIKHNVPLPERTLSDKDHILGGLGPTGPDFEILKPNRDWLEIAWENPEIQVVDIGGDTFWCVTFSHNSAWRFIWRIRYPGEDFNVSERFIAIGSGTERGRGNGKYTVAEWARKNGFVMQEDCPTPNSVDACYAVLDKKLFDKGKNNLNTVEVFYKFLKNNSNASIFEGLLYSPVQVDVQQYAYNDLGYIISIPGAPYIHEVDIVADFGNFYAVWDSENKQYLKYDKSFSFGTPMIHSIKRKPMPILYKQNDNPAIYALNPEKKTLIAFADGVLSGGELFKTLYGVEKYSDLSIQRVNKLPFPIDKAQFTTK